MKGLDWSFEKVKEECKRISGRLPLVVGRRIWIGSGGRSRRRSGT